MARLPSFLARTVGLVLRISPRDFRARYGPEIVDGMERGLRDAAQRSGAWQCSACGEEAWATR